MARKSQVTVTFFGALVGTLAGLLSGCADRGAPSDVRIELRAAGGAPVIASGGSSVALPREDFGADAPSVLRDRDGTRLAYPRAAGDLRILYRVGDGVFVGPVAPAPLDFAAVADTEHALGPLFETAASRRAELVAAVRGAMGEDVLARMLASAAYVDDPSWEATVKTLPPAPRRVLAGGLVRGLEPGRSPVLFRRAVAEVDLDARPVAPLLDARLRDRKAALAEPVAFAVVLRTMIGSDPKAASRAACALLEEPPEAASPVLLEAATLALAGPGARSCPSIESMLAKMLLAEGCAPWFRCRDGAPLGWADTSIQDEPRCSEGEIRSAIDAELARSPRELFATGGHGARPGLAALAVLAEGSSVPAGFARAHERRRYALRAVPASAPSCDARPAFGTPCRCSEAAVRARACRSGLGPDLVEPLFAQTGLCRFDIDDGARALGPVVASDGDASF